MAPDDDRRFEDVTDRFIAFKNDPTRQRRNELVEIHIGLARRIADRLARTRDDPDVQQVAMLGLVKAVDRFDPDRGIPFPAFAGRTIEGEIKRYFRDRTWSVKVPRSAKELHLAVRRGVDELQQQLHRSPTVPEIAAHLDLETDEVLTGLEAGASYTASSLEGSSVGAEPAPEYQGFLAVEDVGFGDQENRDLVRKLLSRLPERERTIVALRFFDELSQSEIGERLGISQMHVSRLLRASFNQMRAWVAEADALADGDVPTATS
jgi:RNA polymerase sigma-B factor